MTDELDPQVSSPLRTATVRGALWNYAAFASSKVATFIATVALARLLVPDQFGLIALGLLVLGYLDALRDFGLASAVIYRRDDADRATSVAFFLSLLSGGLLTVVLILLAPWIARFFREPELGAVLQVLALTFIITSAGAVQDARLRRDFQFRKRLVPEIGRSVCKAVVSVGLALLGAGIWSLVWGQIAGSVAGTVLYWRVSKWRPHRVFDWQIARELLAYGSQIVLLGLLSVVIKDVDYLIIGRTMDAESLGFYSLAFRLPELAVISICYVVSQTVFPVFASVRNDPVALRRSFLETVTMMCLITIPIGAGIAIVASDFVQIFYSAKWLPAVPLMQILSVYSVIISLTFVAGDVYKATGDQRLLIRLSIAQLPLHFGALIVASRWGIEAVATAQLVFAVILLLIQWAMASRILGAGLWALLTAFRPGVLTAGCTCAVAAVVKALLSGSSPALRLLATVTAGALAFAVVVSLGYKDPILRTLTEIRRSRATATGTA